MSVIKSLLIRVEVETTKGSRKCHRKPKKHAIAAGEICLVTINDMGGKRNYCGICATEMITKVQGDVENIKNRLTGM